ncbi:MAG TPA: quinone oxidoreductase [Candidatus Sulfotelmatobacter sp.]|nr:quinone oxidoreductase [Candidatus Sulfotelmatobacter sp.]
MKAIRVHKVGGPEVLTVEEVSAPTPGPGQVLVKLEAIGVNFIDCYFRAGLYKAPLPFIPGSEGAGTVSALGPGVQGLTVGDRVAYAPVMGAYAEYAVVPAEKLVPIPTGVDARTAAAAMLQGMTAQYLATSTCPLKPGDTALVHAAAGGVGLLLVQIAKLRGAKVFGTVSTDAKAALAKEAGADVVIRYTEQDFEAEVLRLTDGRGLNVVYDSVGQTTFDKSLACVGLRGMLALFGQSSGPVPPVDPARLAKNAIFLTRPGLGQYTSTREELLQRSGEVFAWIRAGRLKVRIHETLPLREATQAHRLLEGRKTTGKLLLAP